MTARAIAIATAMLAVIGSNVTAEVSFRSVVVDHWESKVEEEHWCCYCYSVRVSCSANASYSLVWWSISIERASPIVLVTSYSRALGLRWCCCFGKRNECLNGLILFF